ncbi:Dynein axonemal heavy chain 1 [Anthophora quadrimaculata]
MGQLYGEYDLNTREWTDGIFSTLLRAGIAASDVNKRWYVFDGPVDALWIENMNTVLDDNKKLCLTSGEIMKILPTMTMMFEVADLRVASPATVSRCGMVYMEPEGLGLEPLINCWLKRLPKNMSDYIEEIDKLTGHYLLPGLKVLRKRLREIVSTVDAGMVQSYINLMNFRIGPMAGRDGKPPPSAALQKLIPDLLSPWAAFAAVWSLGGSCDYNSRRIFSDWIRKTQKDHEHQLPFPEDGLVFDYRLHDGGFTDPIEGQEVVPPRWYKWLDDVSPITITAEMKFADIEIPTMDSVRSASLIGYLLINDSNLLCIGPTGSGKTLTITAKLQRNMPKKFICDFITFSARTTANQTQDLIDEKLIKRRKDVYGPPILRKQIFFVDDLNMPALDTYGAQPPIELIRQFMDFAGWYDRREIGSFRQIEDVNFVGAMGPPGGGRNPITARLLRHFHFIAFPEMEDDAKRNIFGTILNFWLTATEKFMDMLDAFVNTTLNLFTTICKELLPTPHKSHYTFNLRDLSKVFQGMLMMNPQKVQTREKLLLLWYHENLRVFSDRLINDTDREWFDNLVRSMMGKEFNCDPNEIVGDSMLFFGDFCGTTREYEQITNMKRMENVLAEFLEDYNAATTSPMKLVLFQDAIDHICRINRILRQPRGNALLLGMGGSGRQSLTRLAAHMQDYDCFQIELSSAYTTNDWRDDIKHSMMKAGVQGLFLVFLFSDTQIKDDSMLEDLNSVLNNGDVPNIYQVDEMEKIFHSMRGQVQEAGLQINRSNLFSAYVKTVRNNLHVVITMSPIGETFRARIRQFPALVNCCTIDWFCPWPDAALQSVAMRFLLDIKEESITEDTLESIVRMCQYMHSSVIDASDLYLKELNRHNYVTPTSYLELLSSYGHLLNKKKMELQSASNRLSTGLDKLASAEVEVKNMQQLLADMKPKLIKAAEAAAKMIERIALDTMEAEKTKAQAVEQEAVAAKMKLENQAIKEEAEADLSLARPMLIAAEKSLKALNRNDITEVKAMKRPPVGVLLVIEAVCIINNVKPIPVKTATGKFGETEQKWDYWTPGSQMLSDPGGFLYNMENYDKENLTEDMIKKLKVYIENPDFQPPKIEYVSKACYSLCLWVHAMYNYYFVNQKVKPKMEALAKAEEALEETERTLTEAIQRLKEVEEGVEKLRALLRKEEEKQAELEREKQLCEDRMGRAVRLIDGLAGEQIRWTSTVAELNKSLKNAVGDILLASGAIAYLTPFTDTYRERLLTSWMKVLGEGVPHTPGSDPVSTLGDQVEIRKWQIEGLPRDMLSTENAVLAMHSHRWPLFIDPQAQANKWIRSLYKDSGISVAKMTDQGLLRVLESCIRFGRACLIENIALELEAGLDPILLRSFFDHGGQRCVKVGENIVPYNSDFRLFLTTRLSNPHYTPEVCVKILLVNFALTATGLEDQMLSLVAIQERPDLEQARNALIVSNAEMRRELQEIEDRILYRLSVSEGSAVDDVDLILTLEASKVKSEEIKEGPNPAPEWITPRCWKEIQALENLPNFENFVESFKQSMAQFKSVFDAQEAHLAPYPEPWESRLDDFQKMLILKCLRPDKVTNSMQLYLAKHLGQKFVEPQTTELSAIYNESSPTTPIVFILSTGTDPAAELYKFADRLKMGTKLHAISLGQGQGPRAEAMLKLSSDHGYWCFFQNCHLAPSWMPELESLVEQLSRGKNHRDFRLWLTSAPSPDFPVSILQNSSKMTIEPPRGVKANMFRAYLSQVVEMLTFLQSAHPKVQQFKYLVFSLCLFHSVLLERRKFGPLGFNIPYEFTDGDLRICISQLHMFLLEYETVPFKLEDTATYEEYIEYIKTFPLNDDPALFGMHANADISFAQTETYSCLNTLLTLQPREIGTAAASTEEVTSQLAEDMLNTIPPTFNLAAVQKKYPVLYEESFNTVLLQEAIRYNGLLNVVKSTLVDLLKALKGLVVMSEQLETVLNSLYNNRIPKVWQDKGYPSLKPLGAWFLDLKERIAFLNNWEDKGIPAAFWISGFYFPQAFLTGTLQNFARKHIVSIDTIDFSFQVLSAMPKQRPPDGCVIYGLFLEGCRWDGEYLNESLPKELYTNMKPILLLPEVGHKPPEGIYSCPVYKTITRAGTLSTTGHSTNFVLPMEIPSQKPQSHWIKRGVALICALDY